MATGAGAAAALDRAENREKVIANFGLAKRR